MDNRMKESQNLESMRKMLLIQEEIFKHQVQELHRIYNLQKHLMQELENGLTRHRKAKNTHVELMMFSSHQQSGHNSNFQDFITRDDPKAESSGSGVEKDLKRIEEDNDVEVELTLSIGIKRSKNQSDRDQEQLGPSSRNMSNRDECGELGFYGEKKLPRCLLQDLSLHRT